jgi:hypothetical protein
VPSDWILKRKQEWSHAKGEFERRRALDKKTRNVSASIFGDLEKQVRQDVADYNDHFDHCKCTWSGNSNSFRVAREPGMPMGFLEVFIEDTFIKYKVRTANDTHPRTDHLELKADYDTSEIGFYHKGDRLVDIEAVSEFLLDPILCGPRDYPV